jgi:hypothetical protein
MNELIDVIFLQDCCMYCMQVTSLLHRAESAPFCNWYYLFTLLFLNKQNSHGRNIVFYFFLYICGRAKCLSLEQCVGSSAITDALCCSLPNISNGDQQFCMKLDVVLMLMKGSSIPRIDLNTINLYKHYSLFMLNKLQCTWRGDYCERVRPAQLPVLTELRTPSLPEQYPRYVPHRDRAGYNRATGTLFYVESSNTLHSDRFVCRQAAQRSPLFQFVFGWGPRILVQCVAVNIHFYSPCLKRVLEIFPFDL